jgi:aryl-alcohol dehydrogenase-like predicted oxidoreductase
VAIAASLSGITVGFMDDLERRRVGRSGLSVTVLGLGCNNFGRRLAAAGAALVVHAALDAGVNLFDTADLYGPEASEEILGAALKGRRDGAVVATKFGGPMGAPDRQGASRRWIVQAVEASLRRLDTEWIDLYHLHFPDPHTPIEETLSALSDLVHAGKVRYVGSSNFNGWQIAEADGVARAERFIPFISAQNEYSLLHRDVEREVVPACQRFGVGLIPYLPLAGGLLSGKYKRGEPPPADTRMGRNPPLAERLLNDRNFDLVEKLQAFAAERGIGILDVAIGGLAAQPQVSSVIAGAMTPEQVQANVRAAGWQPSSDDLQEIDRITAS